MSGSIYRGDNLPILEAMPSESVDLIYIDPPFNTGTTQTRTQLKTVRSESGDRTGFHGRRYETTKLGTKSFADRFDDYLAFIRPRLVEAYRVLTPTGSLYFHIDYREVHYCKVLLDDIFGRECFLNEIIWAYDYGARTRKKWPAKHDNILLYVKDPGCYTFNVDDIDRIPYMAPGLVGPEKAARGKLPTDTWWHTIVSPNGREKTGYPTQKPLGILERIIRASSNTGDVVLDFFAGSGTTGVAAAQLGRSFILIDNNAEVVRVMTQRLARFNPEVVDLPSGTEESISTDPVDLLSRVHIIVAGVWDYEDSALRGLSGPEKDVAMVSRLFSKGSQLGLFADAQINVLKNPTVEELRTVFDDYAYSRSATGDILIFYFSGHGATLGNNQFGFCLKDTKVMPGGSFSPLSTLSFDAIALTLTAAQVHPIFIIDACNSGKAGQYDPNKLIDKMQEQIQATASRSYGLFCACYPEGLAEETTEGGAFTKAICDLASVGIAENSHQRFQYLTLADLQAPVQRRLEQIGAPLSKLYVGNDLPQFPLVRNMKYRPRSEAITGYHRQILDLLWNEGKPQSVSLTDIRNKCGAGAYGNHSKLSLGPWDLVEDAVDTRHRRLTERGRQFVIGQLKVPRKIILDPQTQAWRADDDVQWISYSDITVRNKG